MHITTLGTAYFNNKQLDQALEITKLVLSIDPNHRDAHELLNLIYEQKRLTEKDNDIPQAKACGMSFVIYKLDGEIVILVFNCLHNAGGRLSFAQKPALYLPESAPVP